MDISIIEFVVYLIVEMSGIVILMLTAIKDVPMTRAMSIVRAFYLIPGMIAAGVLASTATKITMPSHTVESFTINGTSGALLTNSTMVETGATILLNPVWITFHVFIFIVLMFYVATQIFVLATKSE